MSADHRGLSVTKIEDTVVTVRAHVTTERSISLVRESSNLRRVKFDFDKKLFLGPNGKGRISVKTEKKEYNILEYLNASHNAQPTNGDKRGGGQRFALSRSRRRQLLVLVAQYKDLSPSGCEWSPEGTLTRHVWNYKVIQLSRSRVYPPFRCSFARFSSCLAARAGRKFEPAAAMILVLAPLKG